MQNKPLSTPATGRFLLKTLVAATFLASSPFAFAKVVTIKTNQVINTPTSYNNVTLNLSNSFIIEPGGSLDIENSVINVEISPSNPYFVYMTTGALTLKNNTFNVTVSGISPSPYTPLPYELIQIDQGALNVIHNSFKVSQPYTVAFLITNPGFTTTGFAINKNTLKNFHGGIYLTNSNSAQMDENAFTSVSLSNIWNSGNFSEIKDNIFSFPGNLTTGNAIDLVDSNDVVVDDNIISSSVNFGIHILGASNILISKNKISDGQSYGIMIENPATFKNAKLLAASKKSKANTLLANRMITIEDNYIAQNRYGLTAGNTDSLTVVGNVFIQRFSDPGSRSYWTNNSNLMNDINNLIWIRNYYKEAFTQDIAGFNDLTKQFVTFPEDGGVTL